MTQSRNRSRRACAAALVLLASLVLTPAAPLAGAQSAAQPANPAPPAQSIADKIKANQARLDLNTATPAQLKALPGIGDVYAGRIIAGRPYTMKTQLTRRGIIPESVYSAIEDKVVAHRPKK